MKNKTLLYRLGAIALSIALVLPLFGTSLVQAGADELTSTSLTIGNTSVGDPTGTADFTFTTVSEIPVGGDVQITLPSDFTAGDITALSLTEVLEVVGTKGFSSGSVLEPSFTFSGSTPYMAYGDGPSMSVMKYTGTGWINVGSAEFAIEGGGGAFFSDIVIDSGTPYVSYISPTDGNVHVTTYTGTGWITLGGAGFAGTGAFAWTSSMAFDSGIPYVSFSDDASRGSKMTVMKYTGNTSTDTDAIVNDGWEYVGTGGLSDGSGYYGSMAIDSGIPYVVYMDGANSSKATVMKYTGNTSTDTDATVNDGWEYVGSVGFSEGAHSSIVPISLAFDSGTPYVAYADGANADKATVMKYNGSSWVNVGGAGFSSSGTIIDIYPSLALESGIPYVAYRDNGNSGKATVMKYTGSSTETDEVTGDGWEYVNTTTFSSGSTTNTSIAFNSNILYVAYSDGTNAGKATMMKYIPAELATFTDDAADIKSNISAATLASNVITITTQTAAIAAGSVIALGFGSTVIDLNPSTAGEYSISIMTKNALDVVLDTGYVLAQIGNIVNIVAVVAESIIMTLGSTAINLNVDPSVNSGIDSSQSTTFDINSNAAGGFNIQTQILSSDPSNALYDSVSGDVISNTIGGGENTFAFGLTSGSGASAFGTGASNTGITDLTAIDSGARELVGGRNIGTFQDILNYYLNINYLTAAGNYAATITYTIVPTF